MGFRCSFSVFAAIVFALVLSSCPIPFGYYTAGNELLKGVETNETLAGTTVATPSFVAFPKEGGDGVVVSGSATELRDQTITIDCATDEALVYYTYSSGINQAPEPPTPSPFQSGTRLFRASEPIVVTGDNTVVRIKAIGLKSLMLPSAIASLQMTVRYSVPPPMLTEVVPGVDDVIIAWNAVPGATSYNIYYVQGSFVTLTNGIKLTGVNSPRTVTDLIPNQPYAFTVTAVSPSGESLQGETCEGIPTGVDSTGLVVRSASSSVVHASWNELGDVTNYELYIDTSPTGAFANLVWSGGATSTSLYGLRPGTIYYFKLRPYYHTGSPATPSEVVPAATYTTADMPILCNIPTGSFPPPSQLPAGAAPPDVWVRTETTNVNGWVQGPYTYLVWDHDLQQSYAFAIAAYDADEALVGQWVIEGNGYISATELDGKTWDFTFSGEVQTVVPWRILKL